MGNIRVCRVTLLIKNKNQRIYMETDSLYPLVAYRNIFVSAINIQSSKKRGDRLEWKNGVWGE